MTIIKELPINERPREKGLLKGVGSLTDAELLAIFLRTGIKGKNAIELATELLTDFKGLKAILGADKKEFCKGKGLGEAKYIQLQAVLEMAKRYLREDLQDTQLFNSTTLAQDYLSSQLSQYPFEVFACLFLDNKYRLIQYEELFRGTINQSMVHPREVIRRVLHFNAAAVIFAHNHPSGDPTPSNSDQRITKRLQQALELIDTQLLDHIIIGQGRTCSMLDQGLL